MDVINNIVVSINDVLYQPWCVPTLLIVVGLYFTIRTKFMQGRMFTEMFKVVLEKPTSEDGVSSFGALMVSTASRVGTGNIIGVSTAICLGGPGAILWMWVTAIIGGANAFIESTLAQIFKKKDDDGTFKGGPSYYMRDRLNARWLGIIFSVLIIFTYAVGYNMLAAYNLQSTFGAFDFYNSSTPYIIGIILAVLFGVIVIGGAKRLIKVTEYMVPFMGVIYIAVSIAVLVINAKHIGTMFSTIFASAFDFKSIFGGFAGSCVMWGLKRGLYSNEAGMGSAPNAAARADVSHPVKQGLVQTLSVFIDTILICGATAFMCLSTTGVTPTAELSGAPYVQACMAESLGAFGPIFLTFAMSLFAFTTLIGNYSYCEGCLEFIINREAKKSETLVFRIIATVLVFVGAVATADLVWNTADMAQGLMVVCNIPAIFLCGGIAVKALNDYTRQSKEGKNPVFKADDIGLDPDKLDHWK